MEGGQVEIRAKRKLWVEVHPGNKAGELAGHDALVMFVHGSCANAAQFRDQVGPLQNAGITTVAFDAFGCGSSPKPRDPAAYSPGELYADLEATYERFGKPHRSVFLVAHSFGTCLAVRLAAALGSALSGLVLIGAFHPALGGRAMRGLFMLPEMVLGWLQPTLTQQFLGLAFHEQTRRQRPELLAREAAYSNANPPHMFRAFYRQTGQMFEPEGSYDELLQAVAAPALVISGEADQLTPLQTMGAKVAELLPVARLVSLQHAGHQVHQEQPEAFNAALLEFMRACLEPKDQDFQAPRPVKLPVLAAPDNKQIDV